jgi:hypothetical protein
MIDKTSLLKISRNLNLLAPGLLVSLNKALDLCQAAGLPVAVFEAWRSPERQADLFAQGRTKPGKQITRALPFFSLHQYGLAVDVAYYINGKWSWDIDATDKIASEFEAQGFDPPPSFERCHFQISQGLTASEIRSIAHNSTITGLWLAIGLA